MSAFTASVLGLALFSPVLAPVPPDPQPDPFAKGYLGIWFGGTGPNTSLAIDRLEPNQGAAKAGLRPGDVIEVEVQRGGERKAFKVKLGTRPLDAGRVPNYPVPPPDE